MANELMKRPHFGDEDFDDGIYEPSSDQPTRTNFLRWTEQLHWVDRNGMPPPSAPLLVVGLEESIRRWRTFTDEAGKQFKQPQDIFDKPLPDPNMLNETTPKEEWERQLDGTVSAGWKHEYFVHLVNFATGERFTYSNSTWGAQIAWEILRDAILTMRALLGTKCYPQVELTERPMPSRFKPSGMGLRPHFQILENRWKTRGAPEAVPQPTPTPQLPGSVAAAPVPKSSAPTSAAPPQSSAPKSATPTSATATVREPRPDPVAAPTTKPASAKPPVQLSESTLPVMDDARPVTTEELMNDSLDNLPWDHEPKK